MLIDLTGKTFGRLTVVCRGKTKRRNGGGTEVSWRCKCSCGNDHEVAGRALRGGESKSCGCKPHGKPATIQATINEIFSQYRTRAARKDYGFSLTDAHFRELIDGNCHYCGAKPGNVYRRGHKSSAAYTYNGIDRVDNSLGYTADNVVSCCGICNKAKNTMGLVEFYEWIERVHSHRIID